MNGLGGINWGSVADLFSVAAAIGAAVVFVLTARLRGEFATRAELTALASSITALTATVAGLTTRVDHGATKDQLNEEARKRRDLQEAVVRMDEQMKHLPTAGKTAELTATLSGLQGDVRVLAERMNSVTDSLERETEGLRELIGTLQQSVKLWIDTQKRAS